jgi:hypothetical protein
MSKRTKKNQPASGEAQSGTWHRLLLLLPLTPLIAGILLILGSTFDITVRISPLAQTLLGGLFVLGSFAAFNAIQKQWDLAAGWLLLGTGVWLGLTWFEMWTRVLALLLAGLGVYFLSKEFLRRFRQQQERQAKRGK